MIQGRRHLPWYRESLSRSGANTHLLNCTKCKADHTKEERQRMFSCGYETPIKGAGCYEHPGFNPEVFGAVTVCVGYTAKLPPVREADSLLVHWERGTLEQRIGSEVPEIVLDTLADLDRHRNAADAWHLEEISRESERRRGAQ